MVFTGVWGIVYEMFKEMRNLETFLLKTLYNFALVCYNMQWDTVPLKFDKYSFVFHTVFP